MNWKKLIILGDSNSQFGYGESQWISKISDLFQRKCDVINRGFSGYSTDHIKVILPRLMQEFQPSSICGCLIMLGTNDSTKSTNQIQHVTLDRFRENMIWIIDYLIGFGIEKEKLILISPPRIDDAKWSQEVLTRFGNESTHFDHLVRDYARTSIEVAKEKNLVYFDFHQEMLKNDLDYKDYLNDGLHLSIKGGEFLFKHLEPLLNKHIANGLEFYFPYWRDITDISKLN